MHPKKGIELLIQTFRRILENYPLQNWRIVLAGTGDKHYIKHLKKVIYENRLNDYVLWSGWLSGPMKIAALTEAEIVVLLSRQENFGLTLIEALARKTPVLISDQVNLSNIIDEYKVGWVTSLEIDDIYSKLVVAMLNSDERKRRGQRGYALVRHHFVWSRIIPKLIYHYEESMRTFPLNV